MTRNSKIYNWTVILNYTFNYLNIIMSFVKVMETKCILFCVVHSKIKRLPFPNLSKLYALNNFAYINLWTIKFCFHFNWLLYTWVICSGLTSRSGDWKLYSGNFQGAAEALSIHSKRRWCWELLGSHLIAFFWSNLSEGNIKQSHNFSVN